ncbi:MAG: peptide chain release factor N(5)-glutamine methyltransferase [Pseudomonadota bacterium]
MYEKTTHIAEWRKTASDTLAAVSDTPRLDAELLLCAALGRTRAWLLAHDDAPIDRAIERKLSDWLTARLDHVPIAYLLGYQEFWSLSLKVNRATLIPRPETECLVERALSLIADTEAPDIADLGTGSGAIAIAIATERPDAKIVATDVSRNALAVARENAKTLSLSNIRFGCGDWTEALDDESFDLVVSNPPYVERQFDGLTDNIRHEPRLALVSGDDGLDDIRTLAATIGAFMKPGAHALIEHGHMQGEAVSGILRAQRFEAVTLHDDLSGLPRFTEARKPAR